MTGRVPPPRGRAPAASAWMRSWSWGFLNVVSGVDGSRVVYVCAMTPRIGFLGAGLIATYHSKSLRGSGADVQRAGVFDVDRARAETFAERSGAHVCASEDEVLDGCDAVYICTWTSEHARLVAAAAERGLAVFCEKPLGVNLEMARSMTETVALAGVVNQVGLVLRHSPAFGMLKAIAEDERNGRPMSIVFRDLHYIPITGVAG